MHQALIVLAIAAGTVGAPVDQVASPFDFIRPSKGGEYSFVMLRPGARPRSSRDYKVYSDSSTDKHHWVDGASSSDYLTSGLFRNGEGKPVWTVDWYSFDVRACSDGVHLVRFGPWPDSGDEGKTLAVAFYRNGKKIRSYAVRDLVHEILDLPHSISHYQWKKSSGFDDAGKRLRLNLYSDSSYNSNRSIVFDIRTGLRIQR